MGERMFSRRQFIAATGGALGAVGLDPSTALAQESSWTKAETNTDVDLYGITDRSGRREYVVGGDDKGVILREPESPGQPWETLKTTQRKLRGVDNIGPRPREHVWVVGNSGIIVEYNITAGEKTDYSDKLGVNHDLQDVAVTGEAGNANVFVADGDSLNISETGIPDDGQGKIYYSFDNGTTWNSVVQTKAGQIQAIDMYDDKKGHAVSEPKELSEGESDIFGTDDGTTWTNRTPKAQESGETYEGVASWIPRPSTTPSSGDPRITVCGYNPSESKGLVWHWDGAKWHGKTLPTSKGLKAVDEHKSHREGLTVGDDGIVFRNRLGSWEQETTPTDKTLMAVNTRRRSDVAAGAGGTIIINRRASQPGSEPRASRGWTKAKTPIETTLFDVEFTNRRHGWYAVGADGRVLHRTNDGWKDLFGKGTSNLRGADVVPVDSFNRDGFGEYRPSSRDDPRLWVVGSRGAVVEYRIQSNKLTNHLPGVNETFNDVAVTGKPGEANVFVASASGKVHYSFDNGKTWNSTRPGKPSGGKPAFAGGQPPRKRGKGKGGNSLTAIDFHDTRKGHVVNEKTLFTTVDGSSWRALPRPAKGLHHFYGVDSDGPKDVTVSGRNVSIWHWTGSRWVRKDTKLNGHRDVEVRRGQRDSSGLAVSRHGGVIRLDGSGWHKEATPTRADLEAVFRANPTDPPAHTSLDIAVGANGTIIERQRTQPNRRPERK